MYYYTYLNYCIQSHEPIPRLSHKQVFEQPNDFISIFAQNNGFSHSRDLASSSIDGHLNRGVDQLFYHKGEIQQPIINCDLLNFEDLLKPKPQKYRIHILGLGDVGSHLLIGLKLLGQGVVESIGLYDLNPQQVERYTLEINQIYSEALGNNIEVKGIEQEQLFECDVFVFTASAFVPSVSVVDGDVRMAQFEANTQIVKHYARLAAEKGFKGIFAVVSDPVDLLCRRVYEESYYDSVGNKRDFGLSNLQIFGFGLGVMHARARYFAKRDARYESYLYEGALFGPHGSELVVINSTKNYNHTLSLELTKMTIEANLQIRVLGYKPFIAPAYSSAAMSLIGFLRGEYVHVASFLEGVFFGAFCKQTDLGIVYQQIPYDPLIDQRLKYAFDSLLRHNSEG